MSARSYDEDSIKTLSAMEHIRHRASTYIKSPSTVDAHVQLIKEMLDNSVDESTIDTTKTYHIDVTIFVSGVNYQFVCIDHGRGIPIGRLKDVFTEFNTSGKFDIGSYENTVGTNGQGAKCTVALSERFIGISKRSNGFGYLEVKKGVVIKSESLRAIDRDTSSIGTTILFQPDKSILTNDNFITEGIPMVLDLVKRFATFSNNTITIRKFNGLLPNSLFKQDCVEVYRELVHRSIADGEIIWDNKTRLSVYDYVINRYNLSALSLIFPPISVPKSDNDDERVSFDITVFSTVQSKHGESGILGAVNLTEISAPNSSHLSVFMHQFKLQLCEYIENAELKLFFINNYKLPLSGAVMVKFKGATFEAQTKDNFRDTIFEEQFEPLLKKQLNKIPEHFYDDFYSTIQADLLEKYNKFANADYKGSRNLRNISYTLMRTGSYYDCESSDRRIMELFITEGDSAGDHLAAVRNPVFQGVFKLQGKPPNAFRSVAKMRANDIYKDFFKLLNVTPDAKNLDDMNFNKLILAFDADADGHHIVSLKVANLLKINPLILEQGRVFIANPPLYAIKAKSTLFVEDERALMDIRAAEIYPKLIAVDLKIGKQVIRLNKSAFREFCYMVLNVGKVITMVATNLVIEPEYLELLIYCVNYIEAGKVNCSKVRDILNVDDVKYHRASDTMTIMFHGIEVSIPLTGVAEAIRTIIMPVLELSWWNRYQILITTKQSDLYHQTPMTFMDVYRNIFMTIDRMFSITRFKGLGEMPEASLEFTCVNPETRCLTQIKNIGDVDRIYALMGVDTAARKGLIAGDICSENDIGLL